MMRAAGLVLCLSGLVSVSAAQAPSEEPARPSFSEWLAGVRADAIARGIREETVDAALATVEEPEPTVLERDRAQAEAVLSLESYLARVLKPRTIRTARDMYTRHRKVLAAVEEKFGISPRIIVGIWGLESNFGKFSGVRPTIGALATLAWDPRRATFFRGELLDALQILDRGDIDVARMRGSWAGAMGQPQFMPSSYLKWAEDFDEDGRTDIWSSSPDVFASMANYLKAHGWKTGENWGREVKVPRAVAKEIASKVERRSGSCVARRNMTVALPMEGWQNLGVRLPSGAALPKTTLTASLVSGRSRYFLVYDNYDVLLEYNCSHSYAVSVGLLADRIPRN
jgi:membrane-bound lytic murein transglycosylase B